MQKPDLHTITAPCKLAINLNLSDGSCLIIDEVVRVIPSKRLVCKGIRHQKSVYAKIFMGKKNQSYAERDAGGVKILQLANIATPSLLCATEIVGNKGYALVFEAIENAKNAEEVWAKLNVNQRLILAKSLVHEIAKHHHAGLLQTDLYFKNFLVSDEKIYTLDGDGIRQYTKINERQALQNLSVLLSKFDVLEIEIWLADLLKTYAEARDWQLAPDAALIKKMTNAHRQKVASNYADKKVFRQCSDVNVARQNDLFICLSSQYSQAILPETLVKLDVFFTEKALLKNGNTCTVALTEISGKKIVIKRYNTKSFWHGVSRALRQTRAAASWANAHRLKILDIATAAPIALVEARHLALEKYGLKGQAYFLAEYIDAPDIAQFFAECADKTARAETVKNISTMFYKLYLLKISHGDTKATNIKIVDNQPVLIDLDSMIQHRFERLALNGHVRDLRRFMQNWQESPALYNAFVKAFKVIYPDSLILIKAGIGANKEIKNL